MKLVFKTQKYYIHLMVCRALHTILPSVFLLGPSGVGKSTVGPLLAQKLKLPYIDTDQWIESHYHDRIPTIFQEKGEAYFRSLEQTLLLECLPSGPHVLACGGGAVTIPGLYEALKAKGLVVALEAKPETLASRLHDKLAHRPLLQGGKLEDKLRQLLKNRQPLYEQISHRVPTDSLTPEEVTDQILNLYSPYCLALGPI